MYAVDLLQCCRLLMLGNICTYSRVNVYKFSETANAKIDDLFY